MTLTEVSYYSRRAAPFVIVGILIILILYYSFKILFLYANLNKPPVIGYNTVFGPIKAPLLNDTAPQAGKLTYAIDTIEGVPVSASPSAQVYFLPKVASRFGFREKITLMAQQFDIDTDATRYNLVGQEAQYRDGKNSLNVDIATFNFSYSYDLAKDAALFDATRIPDKTNAQNKAIEFLSQLDRYPQELSQGKTNVIYMHYDPATTQLAVVDDPNQANMVEVDFYRPDLNDYPIVTPKYFNSQNYVAMVFDSDPYNDTYKVIKAQVKYFEASKEQVGIYPLISGDQAYQMLQNGQALFIHLPKTDTITIKKMFLGYLDPDVYQEYLQPVYVFLGNDNFVAYVPAIADPFVAK